MQIEGVFNGKLPIHHPVRCGCPKRTIPASIVTDENASKNKMK